MDMLTLAGIGTTAAIALVRCIIYKKNSSGKSEKIRYYNYRKYVVKHKQTMQALNPTTTTKKGF